ncbi:MAG: DUF4255 domain-containing protein [Chitinophagaceae bacterium]|nr:DUF4255 domain-containing protein [Chitinophagaceae bacterium]
MLLEILNFLQKELNTFIQQRLGQPNAQMLIAGNYSNIQDLPGKQGVVVMSLISLEKEAMLHVPEHFVRNESIHKVMYKQPPVWLNLSCLFIFNSKLLSDYEGINLLEYVIQYFQSSPVITKLSALKPDLFPAGLDQIRSEMMVLNIEQSNYLWGQMGGKYQPSVMYRFRSIPISHEQNSIGPAISEIQIDVLDREELLKKLPINQ